MAKRRMWLWGAVIIVALLAYLGGVDTIFIRFYTKKY